MTTREQCFKSARVDVQVYLLAASRGLEYGRPDRLKIGCLAKHCADGQCCKAARRKARSENMSAGRGEVYNFWVETRGQGSSRRDALRLADLSNSTLDQLSINHLSNRPLRI